MIVPLLNLKTPTLYQIKPYLSMVVIILLTSLSSACQMTTPLANDSPSSVKYGQYYIWLKSLSSEQLLLEENKQNALMTNQLNSQSISQGKLILIYSLPNPIIHQPYKSKRLLNEHLSEQSDMNKDNLAFMMLLKDQLNTQLNLLAKQAQCNQEFHKLSDEHHAKIEQLKQQLNHVNQQLTLLKQIDKNINERG